MPSIINATTTNGVAISPDNSGSLQLATNNGTTAVTIDTSQNVGIGTSSPQGKLDVSSSSAGVTAGDLVVDTANKIVYVGRLSSTSADNGKLVVRNRVGDALTITGDTSPDGTGLYRPGTSILGFTTAGSERMRITSGGDLLVSKTTTALSGNGTMIQPGGILTASVASGSTTYHVWSTTSSTYRFYVNENGGVLNFSGNNVNLSDERSKTNIELAGSYLDKVCAIPVKLFNYKDEVEGTQRTIGVIAQDVEAVAPELVSNEGWEGSQADDGTPLKGIYTQDFMFALMKSIQEQQAQIEELKAEVQALKGVA